MHISPHERGFVKPLTGSIVYIAVVDFSKWVGGSEIMNDEKGRREGGLMKMMKKRKKNREEINE